MISVLFPDAACFTYDLCGKFQSPSPEWMHLTRNLVNFELMVVTEGTLFIADERRSYEVHPGEYLLLPPTVHQHGSKKEAALSTGSILSRVSHPHRSSLLLTRPPDRFWMSFMLHRHPPTALRTSLPPSFHPTIPKRYASRSRERFPPRTASSSS